MVVQIWSECPATGDMLHVWFVDEHKEGRKGLRRQVQSCRNVMQSGERREKVIFWKVAAL